jgi:hypothetical protein
MYVVHDGPEVISPRRQESVTDRSLLHALQRVQTLP